MKIDLKEKIVENELRFFWWVDGIMVSPETGHATLFDAELWWTKSEFYMNNSKESGRWRPKDFDRRKHQDRRKRHSLHDRRTNPQGRRWEDQINKIKTKH